MQSKTSPTGLEKTGTPGIYRRKLKSGETRYVVITRNRDGRQVKTSHRTLAEAREEKARRSQVGGRVAANRERFIDYADEWLDTYSGRRGGIEPTTVDGYRAVLRKYVYPRLGKRRMGEIEPRDIKALIADLQKIRKKNGKPLKPGTVRGILAPVRACLADAAEDGDIPANPAAGVRVNDHRLPEERLADAGKAKALTQAELGRLLAEIPETLVGDGSLTWRDLFELLAHAGLRIAEALGLEWQDVEFGDRPILRVRRQYRDGVVKTLKTKNSRRNIPLSPGLAQKLWAARPASGQGIVFTNRQGKHHSRHNIDNRVLSPAAKRAGVKRVGFHVFRHTCASLLFQGGKNAKQVQRWLGHATATFTLDTYIHLMDDGLGSADFLDQIIQPAPATASDDESTVTAIDPPAADAA